MRGNSPLRQSSSCSAIPVSSQPWNYIGNSDAAIAEDSGDHDALFMLPQSDDLDLVGEWEVEEVGCEEEDSKPQSDDDNIQTMYTLYNDALNLGSDW